MLHSGNSPSYGAPRCSQPALVTCPDRQGCRAQSNVWHGTHRDMCRNRNRHFFVYRTPPVAKQRQRANCRQPRSSCTETGCSSRRPMSALRSTCHQVHSSSTNESCCCPPRRKCREVRSSSTIDSYCPPPEPAPQVACCCPVRQPDKPLCCVPRHRLYEQQRPRFPMTQPPTELPTPYQSHRYSDVQGQVDHFAPAIQAINENIEEPNDPYYNYDRNQQNNSIPGADPMANFDLSRFDRDNIGHNGGYGRRRNVSIRTCVDYDYEPGNQSPVQPYQRPHMPPPGPYLNRQPYANLRQLGPQFVPTQQNRYLPSMESDRNSESLSSYKYVPCRKRR